MSRVDLKTSIAIPKTGEKMDVRKLLSSLMTSMVGLELVNDLELTCPLGPHSWDQGIDLNSKY